MTSNWTRDPRDANGGDATHATVNEFTITNLTSTVAMQCDAVADNAIADVLGTLIKTLQEKGIIGGTSTTH